MSRDHAREREANALYLAGALIFAVGSALFHPLVFEGEALHGVPEAVVLTWGTHTFVCGSLAFSLATFENAMTITVHGTWLVQRTTTKLSMLSLYFSLAGGVLYAVGSVLFYPHLLNHERCRIAAAGGSVHRALGSETGLSQIEEDLPGAPWSTINVGTHYFVAGGGAYLLAALVNAVVVFLKHSQGSHRELHEHRPNPSSTIMVLGLQKPLHKRRPKCDERTTSAPPPVAAVQPRGSCHDTEIGRGPAGAAATATNSIPPPRDKVFKRLSGWLDIAAGWTSLP